MTDGISDAAKADQQNFNEWKKREIQTFLSLRSTKELVEELAKREGVKEIIILPYEWYQVSGEKEQWDTGLGPARILVVID